jgi:hypothetical protein
MATTEGTSELISKQWKKLATRFPRIPESRAEHQVRAGPRRVPLALPHFRRQGPLASAQDKAGVFLPAWRNLRGTLAQLQVPDDIQLDRCWVYLVRDGAAEQPDPERVIAQGTLEGRSLHERFPLLGARTGDTVLLILEHRDRPPVVLRAAVAGNRLEEWRVASPATFPAIDIIPEPAPANAAKADISVQVSGDALPEHVSIFPLGHRGPLPITQQQGANAASWSSDPRATPTLDGHVLMRWGQGGGQMLISTFSQGGGPATSSPFPANPITAGSADGGVMLFFNKGPTNSNTYGHIKVVATIAHGMGRMPVDWRERGYAYSLAGNDALPTELTPTLVMYYDPLGPNEEALLQDGDLRICRWSEPAGWTPLPTYLPPAYRFAVAPLDRQTGGALVASNPNGPRVEYYKVCWVPRQA